MRSAACTVAAGSPCAKYSWVSRSSASSAHGERPNSTTTRCRFVAAVEASAASIADVYSASGYADSAGASGPRGEAQRPPQLSGAPSFRPPRPAGRCLAPVAEAEGACQPQVLQQDGREAAARSAAIELGASQRRADERGAQRREDTHPRHARLLEHRFHEPRELRIMLLPRALD